MRHIALGIGMLLAWPLALHAALPPVARFAMVIGYNQAHDPGVRDLHFADDDAIATHALLREAGVESLLFVSMDADSQRLHPALQPTAPPTPARLLQHFAILAQTMRRLRAQGTAVEFYLFYSGHGDVDHGEGFVELADGRLTRTMLYQDILAQSPATANHMFIDACKSYFMAFERGPGGARRPYNGVLPLPDSQGLQQTGVVLSTSSAQDSHEWEPSQGGVFSHELRSALWGGADVDGNGVVTYGELGAFLNAANAAIANPRLRPDFLIVPPPNDSSAWQQAVFAWPVGHASVLLNDDAGHVYVEDTQGQRLLDAHPHAGVAQRVHVPTRAALYLHDAGEAWERTLPAQAAAAEPLRVSEIAKSPVRLQRRGALQHALADLFAVPFGRPELQAFESQHAVNIQVKAAPDRAGPAPWLAWSAAAGLLAGAGLDVWAWQRYASGEHAPQAQRVELNRQVTGLHVGALVLYGVAAAAATWWAVDWLNDPAEDVP